MDGQIQAYNKHYCAHPLYSDSWAELNSRHCSDLNKGQLYTQGVNRVGSHVVFA